jgi:enamine deaminase RidA (YjgF/YER057c/UK114 family)
MPSGSLASFGVDFSNVVKVTIFVVNYKPSDREILVKVRDQYVDPARPLASTLLGVQSLARPELLIEIEALAVVDN